MAQKKRWNGDIENIALQESSDNSLQEKSLLQNTESLTSETQLFVQPAYKPPKKEKKRKKRKNRKKKEEI